MILSASNIQKSFGAKEILRSGSFLINEQEKAAIVGINGAGKTTLLKILTGEESADSGTVSLAKNASLGYLAQINHVDSNASILEEMLEVIRPVLEMEEQLSRMQEEMTRLSGPALEKIYEEYTRLEHRYELAEGYQAKSQVTGILKGLGFGEEEFEKKIHTLSGGQKTRVFLGKLLLQQHDIILLDEPTNHLDLSSIEWLETYLLNYRGAVVIVSHDRYFLDRTVTKVIDIDHGSLETYSGNYSDYVQKKAQLQEAKRREYQNQQQEIKHQEEVIAKLRSFNREKSIKRAESRQKLLDRIERVDRPLEEADNMQLNLEQERESGKDVLQAAGLSKSFGERHLFQDLNFEIKRGEHVAIMGDNGTGKTTLLKIINGMLPPDTGQVLLGSNVQTAYYDQEHQVLHGEKTLFEELSDTYPQMDNTRIRNVLAAFLFTGEDVFKRISDLSGGERGRVSLAKLMLSKANFLLLDEPTNHLDLFSKEVLEGAIRDFPGTVLYVSHDRYFINRTATRILELTQHKLLNYIGNYDYYLEKKQDVERANLLIPNSEKAAPPPSSTGRDHWKSSKAESAKLKKQREQLQKCETSIEETEQRITEIEKKFEDPAIQTNVGELMQLQKQKDVLSEKLESLMETWEALSLEAES